MARFFFDLRDGDEVVSDPDGSLMACHGDAMAEALRSARWIMSDQLRANRGVTLDRQFEISNEAGQIQGILHFRDAFEDRRP